MHWRKLTLVKHLIKYLPDFVGLLGETTKNNDSKNWIFQPYQISIGTNRDQ